MWSKEILTMPYIITHYLPELDQPKQSFLMQLTATMPEANVDRYFG